MCLYMIVLLLIAIVICCCYCAKVYTGSGTHIIYTSNKDKIAEYYRNLSYTVEVEKTINGKPDIIITNQDKRTAIEVETGKSNILANILKSINSFDLLIIVATNKDAEDKIRDIAQYFPSEKIKLISTKGFYRGGEDGV